MMVSILSSNILILSKVYTFFLDSTIALTTQYGVNVTL